MSVTARRTWAGPFHWRPQHLLDSAHVLNMFAALGGFDPLGVMNEFQSDDPPTVVEEEGFVWCRWSLWALEVGRVGMDDWKDPDFWHAASRIVDEGNRWRRWRTPSAMCTV